MGGIGCGNRGVFAIFLILILLMFSEGGEAC